MKYLPWQLKFLVVQLCFMPLLCEETFLLFSIMDVNYQPMMINYTASKLQYAKSFGYTFLYNLSDFNLNISELSHHPTAHRIYAADKLLSGKSKYAGPNVDWIVYIDSDAFIAEQYCPMTIITKAAESFTEASSKQNLPCQFISQDAHGFVNSGFWMIRNSSYALDFIHKWKESFEFSESHGYVFTWLHDQGALLNAMLHVYFGQKLHPLSYLCYIAILRFLISDSSSQYSCIIKHIGCCKWIRSCLW